ncbi:MAG: DUF4396 domain-containing protein [Acidobacteria bacterium]|nr:DUF4396 domain-containing protein [Acidobacteriota bacterium]
MTILTLISWISLGLAFLSAIVIAVDELRRPQEMWIMNIVWPVTALYFSIFAVWAYFRIGTGMTKRAMQGMSQDQMQQHKKEQEEQARRNPAWHQTAVSDSHCGAGCTLGDIIAEFSIFGLGLTLFSERIFAEYAGDLLLAWLLGIVFQYFTIKPMRNLSPAQGLLAAVKADTLSILTFEIGLFAWMAITYFILFPHPHLKPNQPAYWFMMQIGMVLGFFTSYPMNRVLVKIGWKEAMG